MSDEAASVPEVLDDEEIDARIVSMRIAGMSERGVCKALGVPRTRVRKAVDAATQDALQPAARLRSVFLAQARVNELLPIFQQQARRGDCQSAMVVVRLLEREAITIGLGGLHQGDPIEMAKEVAPRGTSTEQLLEALRKLRSCSPREEELEGKADRGELTDAERGELEGFRDERELRRRTEYESRKAALPHVDIGELGKPN